MATVIPRRNWKKWLLCVIFNFGGGRKGGGLVEVRGNEVHYGLCKNGEERQSLRNIVNCQYGQLTSLLVARGVASP